VETVWYTVLGLFFASYLVLGGCNYGVGMLVPRAGTAPQRRVALNAVGPFFLANEVWLAATAGLLFGAFPMLEGELLSGLYPLVSLAVAGVVLVITAFQLRSRAAAAGARRWDRLIVTGSLLAAGGWGAVLGALLQGVPLHPAGHVAGTGHVATAFTAACALTLVALAAAHGAAFLTLRLPAGPAGHFARLGRRLLTTALATLGATVVVGLLSADVRAGARRPGAAVLLLALIAAALVVARVALDRRRPGPAFAATCVAMAAPVLLVGATTWPYALASTVDPAAGLTVADAAASGATLRVLGLLALPLLPALLGFQLMCWWAFRGRVEGHSPRFY
jgi:cytochrome d ubiquinol oxidase subunit II